jgi:hypothetical protein
MENHVTVGSPTNGVRVFEATVVGGREGVRFFSRGVPELPAVGEYFGQWCVEWFFKEVKRDICRLQLEILVRSSLGAAPMYHLARRAWRESILKGLSSPTSVLW